MRRTVLSLLLLATAVGCAAPPHPEPAPDSARGAEGRFLAENYGFAPAGSRRILRDFRDLLEHRTTLSALHHEPALTFGKKLAALTGYHLVPTDAPDLLLAAGGPAGAALADPAVDSFLSSLRKKGLLDQDAGADLLRLDKARASALERLAARPGAIGQIQKLAHGFPFVFSPRDALFLLADPPPSFSPEDRAFLAKLLPTLFVKARASWFPEIRNILAGRSDAVALVDAARRAHVHLTGSAAILVLSRLLIEDPVPLTPADVGRLERLAGWSRWPDAGDYFFLVPLCRRAGILHLVGELRSRYRYRFRAQDGPDLVRLLDRPLPTPKLPDWMVRERVPLTHPADLLGPDPAAAFVDPDELRFMRRLERIRPDLVHASRDWLERRIRDRIRDHRVRYRLAAPYTESTDDLSRFLRPALLEAWLLLDFLDRPQTRSEIEGFIRRDLADRGSELGGWVVMDAKGHLRFVVYGGAGEDRNDRLYLPDRSKDTLLEFHLHATDEDDTDYAGPSSGGPGTDLYRATKNRVNGLVITKLEGPDFDCDLYTSGQKVLDLGVRRGPPPVKIR